MNKKRQAIYDKYNGRCAYCGCALPDKWHVDHLKPIIRMDWARKDMKPQFPELDCLGNLMPACPSCNIDKHSYPLEAWRTILQGRLATLNRLTAYKFAKRFGQLVETPSEIVFYFEKEESVK